MGVIYFPPSEIKEKDRVKYTVFLAGSIEMGVAYDWQSELSTDLETIPDLMVLNPRRKEWDNSWKQDIKNPKFREQVDWELDGIKMADTCIFYLDPKTKSPITLMELGKYSEMIRLEKKMIICCPEGFYRKGNVDIVVDRAKKELKQNTFFPKNGNIDDYILEVGTLKELLKKSVEFLKKQVS